jgi:predicted DsbA family dithiol-disulfide isomerase
MSTRSSGMGVPVTSDGASITGRVCPRVSDVRYLSRRAAGWHSQLIAVAAACSALVACAAAHRAASPAAGGPRRGPLRCLVRAESHREGPASARLTIVEFADFQCDYCAAEQKILQDLPQVVRGEIRLVFRQFPLTSVHPQAEEAAEASECAAEQGRFWQSVSVLYRDQNDLSGPALKRYAVQLGLDSRSFNECLDGHLTAGVVRRDIQDGRAFGVRGTPTFFIGRRKVEGVIQVGPLVALIREQLMAGPAPDRPPAAGAAAGGRAQRRNANCSTAFPKLGPPE